VKNHEGIQLSLIFIIITRLVRSVISCLNELHKSVIHSVKSNLLVLNLLEDTVLLCLCLL